MEFKFNIRQTIGRCTVEKRIHVGFQERKCNLAFRIPKSHVEFHHVRVIVLVDHQPDEEDTSVRYLLTGEVFVHWFNDALNDFFMNGG